jgi:glutamate synthase (NADPH/NADH) small chain
MRENKRNEEKRQNMYDLEIIQKEANWCLGCKMKPCSKACPMHTNIPEFIEKVKESKFEEAYNILIENNLFSHVCSLICPQENQCQGACVRGIKTEPTKIGKIETFVNEWAIENGIKAKISQKENVTDKKVAIIGAGPAGLSCSFELAKAGIKSVIFEKEECLGGILTYGIPDFRLSKETVENIINVLKSMGVEFKLNSILGKNISIRELKEEYDYVFVGVGAELSSMYKLSEEKLDSVYDSDTFLRAYNYKKFIPNLGKVVVIGGGNVAMDSARAAVHMGAESVSILYRRDREHMPAREIELDEALEEGVKFEELIRVDSANIEDGKMKSVHCNRTQIIDGKAVDVENDEFDYDADTVVFAIGLKPNREMLMNEGLILTDWGTIEVDENNQTSIENVYAGGDVVDNKSVVCKALASGKKAANSIIEKIG